MKNIKAERELSLDFLRVTEAAAIESAKTMGQGDRKYSDHVAVEAMREVMDTVPMRGRIVIGEGERDEAPMLYIGEEVGGGIFSEEARAEFPEVDIAVDPLEGTNLCALGANNAIAVLAAAERGGLLNAPVAVTRVKLMVGERIEIMVNLGNDALGSSLDLKAYNSGQTLGFPGGEPNTSGQFGSLLNNIDFSVLHINVAATTTATTPITAVPSTLASNTYWTAANATVTRTLTVTGGQATTPFSLDNHTFVLMCSSLDIANVIRIFILHLR